MHIVALIAYKVFSSLHSDLIGVSLSEPHTSMVYGNTCIDRLTDQPTDRSTMSGPIHVIWIRCMVVYSAVCSGDSYNTENADNGKVKS